MHTTLPEVFFLASSCGVWEPRHWKSRMAVIFYNAYTIVNVVVMILLLMAQLIALIFMTENMEDFAEASYVFLASFNGCVKGANFLWQNKRVGDLSDALVRNECLPKNFEEIRLCSEYDKMARYTVLLYSTLVGISSGATAILPVFFAKEEYTLQLKAWYPYNVTSDLTYWCSYVHQAWGILIGAAWNVTGDTVIAGLMMQTCAQLDLMTFRLQVLPENTRLAILSHATRFEILRKEERAVKESVRHHLQIFRFVNDLKSIFAPSIFIQFCLSMVILCITIYELTAKNTNTLPVSFVLIFLSSMLVELFLYCWFGNEVTLKSLEFNEAICKSDWTELDVSTLKEILIMMIRTTSPIFITCGPFITLSLNSYTGILKLSYSVFNLLENF